MANYVLDPVHAFVTANPGVPLPFEAADWLGNRIGRLGAVGNVGFPSPYEAKVGLRTLAPSGVIGPSEAAAIAAGTFVPGGTRPVANFPSLGYSAGYPSGWGGFGGEIEEPWWMTATRAVAGGLGAYYGAQGAAEQAYYVPPTGAGQMGLPTGPPSVGACPTRPRLPTAFVADDPCGGSPRVFRNMGAVSSALMPGDFRAHRRVNKLAAKARRPRARARKR